MISEGFFLSVLVKKILRKTQKEIIFQFENFHLNFSIQKISK